MLRCRMPPSVATSARKPWSRRPGPGRRLTATTSPPRVAQRYTVPAPPLPTTFSSLRHPSTSSISKSRFWNRVIFQAAGRRFAASRRHLSRPRYEAMATTTTTALTAGTSHSSIVLALMRRPRERCRR